MDGYFFRVVVPDGKVKEILDRLRKAQEEIYKCYDELTYLNVLKIEKADSGNQVFRYSMHNAGDGKVLIAPANGDEYITIHGEEDAEDFISHLRDCIRTE